MSWDEEYQVELDKGSKFLVNNTYSRALLYRHLLQFYRQPINTDAFYGRYSVHIYGKESVT